MIGKDVGFMSLFYAADSSLVAPLVLSNKSASKISFSAAQSMCRGYEDGRLPNLEELGALFLNKELLGVNELTGDHDYYWASTASPDGGRYVVSADGSYVYKQSTSSSAICRCVKRN